MLRRPIRGRGVIAGVALVAVATVAVAGLWIVERRVPGNPPALVVEGLVGALADHRFDVAVRYLSRRLRDQIIPLTLEVRTTNLERRTGRITDIRGRAGWQRDTRAYATAEADTERAGRLQLGFGLVRERNAWRIDELYDLYR